MGNPPVNALAPALLDGLDAALDEFEAGPARVFVIASAVPGFFAAGADIKTMANIDRAGFVAYGKRLRSVVERVALLDRPTVAVIEGRALGGGMELALAWPWRAACGLPVTPLSWGFLRRGLASSPVPGPPSGFRDTSAGGVPSN
jgi:enoyl-CoA hydratase